MKLEAIYFISQVIAAVALVGSLVFVGIQIRQVSERQRREAVLNREAQVTEGMRDLASGDLGELMFRCAKGDNDISDLDLSRLYFAVGAMLVSIRARFHEYQQGLLTEEQWRPLKGNIEYLLCSPGLRSAFIASRETAYSDPDFDAEFAEALSKPPSNVHDQVIARIRELNAQLCDESAQAELSEPPESTQAVSAEGEST